LFTDYSVYDLNYSHAVKFLRDGEILTASFKTLEHELTPEDVEHAMNSCLDESKAKNRRVFHVKQPDKPNLQEAHIRKKSNPYKSSDYSDDSTAMTSIIASAMVCGAI
jgi:hypothetical protein